MPTKTFKLPSARALAVRFIQRLEHALTAAELREVRRRNRRRANDNTCATHDFCDANMVMAGAWKDVAGYFPDPGNDAMAGRWSDAWAIADKLLGGDRPRAAPVRDRRLDLVAKTITLWQESVPHGDEGAALVTIADILRPDADLAAIEFALDEQLNLDDEGVPDGPDVRRADGEVVVNVGGYRARYLDDLVHIDRIEDGVWRNLGMVTWQEDRWNDDASLDPMPAEALDALEDQLCHALAADGWTVTHEITHETADGVRVIRVALVPQGLDMGVHTGTGGPAYTRAEWTAEVTADWERQDDGTWTFQGAVPVGQVSVVEVR